ncbi:TM2 domain-containing protein [Weeksellaceae bacterium A-14]
MEKYGYNEPQNGNTPAPYHSGKKIAAALLGIFLGAFGANKFFLGYIKEGIIQIVLNIVTCGIATVLPFIEGIIYLTMSDQQFDNTYVRNKKGWF